MVIEEGFRTYDHRNMFSFIVKCLTKKKGNRTDFWRTAKVSQEKHKVTVVVTIDGTIDYHYLKKSFEDLLFIPKTCKASQVAKRQCAFCPYAD